MKVREYGNGHINFGFEIRRGLDADVYDTRTWISG